MGLRFQRRIRILPGVRLNISKSGVSTSVGGRGAWLTFGRRGTRATVGLPGTGISYTTTSSTDRSTQPGNPEGRSGIGVFWLIVLLIAAILIWRLAVH